MRTKKVRPLFGVVLMIGLLVTSTASGQEAGNVTNERVLNESTNGENWFVSGGDFSGSHYSALDQIDKDNVASLGLAWSTEIPAPDGIAGTPIVVDGTIYLGAAYSVVYALDASSGQILWSYDPDLRSGLAKSPRMSWPARANRGVAVWGGNVFVATADCRLIAINAATGKESWSELTCDPELGYGITDAPRVGGGKVFIGNAGSESQKKNRGYVSAYDSDTGRLLWRFYTVPSTDDDENDTPAMKMAAKTWSGTAWQEFGGGGSVWNEMTYDPVSDLLYFGTAGAVPYLHKDRSPDGLDNLFLSSVVAVNASSGEYVWHYQTVPEESWDYNANMNIVLANLNIGGESRGALMIAPKNGFFYVLDRLSGELLSAEKYAKVNWASHINLETGRPVLTEEGNYWDIAPGETVAVWPNMWGAHSWQPMAYHPGTGLVYIPVVDVPSVVQMHADGSAPETVELVREVDGEPHAPGKLSAWDPVTQKKVWSVDLELPFNGGVMVSAGDLAFQGTATGYFSAYDAATGASLWSVNTGSAINSAPVSYATDDQQHILIAVGAGGGMQFNYPELHGAEELRGPTRVMAFTLEGNPEMLPIASAVPKLPDLPELELAPEIVDFGYQLYHDDCSFCHGKNARARSNGSVPDLRYSSEETHKLWNGIVIGGAKAGNGMPPSDMDPHEADAIRMYVLSRAYELKEQQR